MMAVDPTSDTSKSAKDTIVNTLDQFGLGQLADWAWNKYLTGEPVEQIILEMRDTPEYKARFPGMDQLRAKGLGWDESKWISYEQTAKTLMRQYGLPDGFLDDHASMAKLITGQVGLPELETRLQIAQQTAAQSVHGQNLRDQLSRLYGLPNAAQLAIAYEIDPDKAATLIQQQFTAAQSAVAADQAGFGSLTRQQAELVGGTGQSADQLGSEFGRIAGMKELTTQLPGQAGSVTTNDLIGAGVLGNADAADKVQKEASRRAAMFAAGGGYAASASGVSGLGSAST